MFAYIYKNTAKNKSYLLLIFLVIETENVL